jgi:hypothetical protein
MTKVTLMMTICGVLATAACSQTDAPIVVGGGPQVQDPAATAPGGKLADGTMATTTTAVIIDDSAMVSGTVGAGTPALAQTSTSIFEFIR